jgi:hypothetical protein
MKKLRFRLTLLGGALLMLAFTSVASAQATRTWVSGVGDDANPCSRTAPCKTFGGAISKTADGGEIDCLDPGGFGAVTITKSMIIDCDSGTGGILSSGVNAVVVNANASTSFVILRNLTINGTAGPTQANDGPNGLVVISAHLVGLEDVVMNNFTTNCATVTSTGTVNFYADDSKFINCGSQSTSAGVAAGANAKVVITRSMIATPGLGVSNTAGGSQIFITGSTISGTTFACQSSAGAFIGASGNTLANNGTVFNQNGGQIFTGSDNPGFGNGPTGPTTGAVGKI